MEIVQWVVAAGTTIFVATVGYFQWRTASKKQCSICSTDGMKFLMLCARLSAK